MKKGKILNKKNRPYKNRFFFVIRFALILSIIINIVATLVIIFVGKEEITRADILSEASKRISFALNALLTLLLTYGSPYIQKKGKLNIPEILDIVIILFIFASTYLSARYNLYYRLIWWDTLLHTLSGIIIGFIGVIMIYKINYKFSMNLSPLLVAVFAFTFAVTLGVFWEIFEFSCDVFLGTAMQKWDLPNSSVLLGRDYQGSGLRDTMLDLIVDALGALFTSVIAYFMVKNENKKILEGIKKIVD